MLVGHIRLLESFLLVVGVCVAACCGDDPKKRNPTPEWTSNAQNASDPRGTYRVALCPPSVCEVDLFHRSCFRSKEPICPTLLNMKATVCCSAGCCEPRSSPLKEFFGKFWLIVAIVFGIVITSATSVWLRRSQQWNRGFYMRRRHLNQQGAGSNTVNADTNAPAPTADMRDHPPAYDDALGFPKPEDGLDSLAHPPSYNEVELRRVAGAAVPVDTATPGIAAIPAAAATAPVSSSASATAAAAVAFPLPPPAYNSATTAVSGDNNRGTDNVVLTTAAAAAPAHAASTTVTHSQRTERSQSVDAEEVRPESTSSSQTFARNSSGSSHPSLCSIQSAQSDSFADSRPLV
eukprot:scpid68303/ scgid24911/ 